MSYFEALADLWAFCVPMSVTVCGLCDFCVDLSGEVANLYNLYDSCAGFCGIIAHIWD